MEQQKCAIVSFYVKDKEIVKYLNDIKEELNLPNTGAVLMLFCRMYYKNKDLFFKELFDFIPRYSLFESKKIDIDTLIKNPLPAYSLIKEE